MGSTTYLRHRIGEPRLTPRSKFEPLAYDHPLIGTPCAECDQPFVAGQRPTLLVVGPDDLHTAEEADAGHWYRALAVALHEGCAWPEPGGHTSGQAQLAGHDGSA